MAPKKAVHDHHYHLILVMLLLCVVTTSYGATEGEVLIKFRNSLSNASALNDWNTSISLCNGENKSKWNGLICKYGKLYGLRLENMGLMGTIDIDALSELTNLRSLSFMYNNFKGSIPEVKKIGALRSLFLSHNQFSGEIPEDAFVGMRSLQKVHLGTNGFIGKIPKSLAGLTKLVELDLKENQFEGKIPDFDQKNGGWLVMNVSFNRLHGRIPSSLSKLQASSFIGNKGLCGKPLGSCKSSKKHVILIALLIVAAALATFAAILFILSRRAQKSKTVLAQDTKAQIKVIDYEMGLIQAQSFDSPQTNHKMDHIGALLFVRKDRERFELEDLLRASAEVLGSGSFGSTYKAIILNGPTMVVKRFKNMSNVGKEEFYEHMRRLGRLSHPNLLPLVAFYFKKEEKLLVSDFVPNGSLASHLHSKRAPGEAGLDWPTRLNIIKGVARGLAYLYKEFPGLSLPHGHLKSSNILLDHNYRPILSEYTLVPMVNKDHAQKFMAAYKSPEFNQSDHTTTKSDVWCLGILILELLTGKFPANYLRPGKRGNSDLATWVNAVVREEWTAEVFEKDMKSTKNGEGEMLKLLKIGMSCCEASVEGRWDWREAVDEIEELKERDEDIDSSFASDGDIFSTRAMTEG